MKFMVFIYKQGVAPEATLHVVVPKGILLDKS